MRKKILYIQHAGNFGGSCMSLLYTMQGLDLEKFEPVVALIRPTKKLVDFYEAAGFQVFEAPGIYTFEHTTAASARLGSPLESYIFLKGLINWRRSVQLTLELVDKVKPDLVHLNSVVLLPSAVALGKADIPFVWHVREAPVKGYFGLRKKFMSSQLKKYGEELIFISPSARERWVGNVRGRVVENFVDIQKFNPDVSGEDIGKQLGISKNMKVILFLGGISEINGLHILIDALALLKESFSDFICISAGVTLESSGSLISRIARGVLPVFGCGVLAQKIQKQIDNRGINEKIRFLPFQKDIRSLMALTDVLVFPATEAHFARPVVEAAAMRKPSIGSDLDGINELIEDGRTGLLVRPDSPEDLANALLEILSDSEKAELFGQNAIIKAKAGFSAEGQMAKITGIYDSIFN